MRNIIMAAATACFLAPATAPAALGASECKGLDQASCTASSACVWREAVIAGQSLTKAGELAKRSAKAHCRKGSGKPPKPAAAKPAQAI